MRFQSALVVLVLSVGAFCAAQTVDPRFDRHHHADEWGWTRAAWTEDDRDFKATRLAVKAEAAGISSAKRAAKMARLAEVRSKVLESSPDSQKLFLWAYTAYEAAALDPAFASSGRNLKPVSLFPEHSRDHSYEFARIRFLMAGFGFPSMQLIAVGERLLQRDPSDEPVKYALIRLYQPARSAVEEQKARSLAEAFRRTKTDDYRYCDVIASVYYLCYLKTKLKEDGATALKYYRRFLELAPREAGFRPKAKSLVEKLERDLHGS